MKKRILACLLALVMLIGAMPVMALAAETVPTDFDWKVSKSKTATDLDADGSTRVTLSLPSAEETLTSDVVFVLDGSSSADTDVVKKSVDLLDELKQAAGDNGATVNVCIVKFKRQAFKSDWYDLATHFEDIKDAMKTKYSGGTNIHAGLLAGKEALEEHTNVSASRKYLVLVSDGSTYLYSKDGNWASDTPFTRSYHPANPYNSFSGGYWDNGYYEPNNYPEVNVPRPKDTSEIAAWQNYLEDVEARNTESHGDDYDYHCNYDLNFNQGKPSADYKPQPCVERSANNRDMAFYYADQTWQQMREAGYNLFSIATKDGSAGAGNSDDSRCFMNYLNGGQSLDFSDIKNEIFYAVGRGSTVEDCMGYDTRNGNNYNFDLVPSSLILTVGGQSLASLQDGNTYYFGDADVSKEDWRFKVVYTPADDGKEKFVWTINEAVSNFSRVQLSYQLRLRDDARTSKDNYFYTNISATLKPMDSKGHIGSNQTFDRPRVTFGADADYLLPILSLNKATPKLNTRDHFAYVQGYPDGTVKPAGSITRAEVAAILFRLMDADSRSLYYSTASGFRDVDSTKWYNTYVATLNNAGVITDSRTGYFRPNDAITRAELAAMLAQFAEKKSAAIYFSDVSAGYWAANAIALTANLGWINGYPDGTFGPDKTVTRAELMAMVNRATGRAPESTSALLSGMKTWKDNADTARWYYLDVQEATNSHTYLGAPTETWTSLTATPDWSQYE